MPSRTGYYGTYPVVITRFAWPSSEDITKIVENEDLPTAQLWITGIKSLLMAPSHKNSVLARIIGNSSEMILFTTWEDLPSSNAFYASDAHAAYLSALSLHGPLVSTVQRASFTFRRGMPIGFLSSNQHISLRTMYFPAKLTEAAESTALAHFSMREYHYARSVAPLMASGGDWRSWLEGEIEHEGSLAKAMSAVHWWTTWETRRGFVEWREPKWEVERMFGLNGELVTQRNVGMTREEVWDRTLTELGALGWKDELCDTVCLPTGEWYAPWKRFKERENWVGWPADVEEFDPYERMRMLAERGGNN